MILVGQYGSPDVRRVGMSLRALGFEYDTRSVFGDLDPMGQTNPIGPITLLVLVAALRGPVRVSRDFPGRARAARGRVKSAAPRRARFTKT
jgi:hypothetical protein